MPVTARHLNRATLDRQLLLRRDPISVDDAVRRIVAIQAQEPASPYIALWNRVARFAATDLDTAFADHTVVKASLLRMTLHAVHADDYPAFHEAMQGVLRASRLADDRFTSTGMAADAAEALVPHVVEHARSPRTNADMEAMLAERHGDAPTGRAWWALRTFAPLWHAPTGGPWSFGPRPAYVAARTTRARVADRAVALQTLARRYVEGFGPVSARDLAQFARIAQSNANDAMRANADHLQRLDGPDGKDLFDVRGRSLPDEDTPCPPRLMAMWDSVLMAYADRTRVVPQDFRRHVTRTNGDVLPTILVDGYVAGVWRPADGGIEISAFRPLTDDDWDGLEVEARGMVAFLGDRDPAVYRRYSRWWSALPAVDVRVLGG